MQLHNQGATVSDNGWTLPEVINPDNNRCACIPIPDDLNHIRAFWGALYELGYQFNWQRDDAHNALPVSVKWMAIVRTAHEKWLEGVMCGSCEEFTACLEPLYAAVAQLQSGITALQYGAPQYAPHELTEEEMLENMAGSSNPSCNDDILWSQCLAVVETTNEVIVQAIEVIEADTNVLELINSLSQVPIADEFGLDAISSLITGYQNAIAENYAAAYSPEYRDELACALFCACQVDCAVSVERMWQIVVKRAEENISGVIGDWGSLVNFINDLITMDIDEANVADFAFLMVWGTLKFGNFMNPFIKPGNRSVELAILLAADEPSNDWILLCDDCPTQFNVLATVEPPGNDTGYDVVSGTDYAVTASGTWNGGVGAYTANGQVGALEPTATIPTAWVYSLIWRIGTSGAWQPGSASFTISAASSGRLYMMINDCDGCRGDNSGAVSVEIGAV